MADADDLARAEAAPYPVELYAGCPCYACDQKPRIDKARAASDLLGTLPNRMSLCPRCGWKRCAGALDHTNPCTPDEVTP